MDPRALSQPWLHEAVGTAEWGGTPLWPLLAEAGIDAAATEVVFTGLDRGVERGVEQAYARSLSLEEARRPEVLLVDEMNGSRSRPSTARPCGWWSPAGTAWRASSGSPASRSSAAPSTASSSGSPTASARTRSSPANRWSGCCRGRSWCRPGIPDFFTRERVVRPGPLTLAGRAWSGRGPIERVEVSADGGSTWTAAVVDPPAQGPWAWQSWTFDWTAEPGEVVLACRAIDGVGPTDAPPWNVGGYANPAPHRVEVTVLG